jgi:hypothetical protein
MNILLITCSAKTSVHKWVEIYICVCVSVCVHVFISVGMHTCEWRYACVCASVHVCVCMHVYSCCYLHVSESEWQQHHEEGDGEHATQHSDVTRSHQVQHSAQSEVAQYYPVVRTCACVCVFVRIFLLLFVTSCHIVISEFDHFYYVMLYYFHHTIPWYVLSCHISYYIHITIILHTIYT